MRTRRGFCYPSVDMWSEKCVAKRRRDFPGDHTSDIRRKRTKKVDYLDYLPDDLVLTILSKLSSTADCPADFGRVLMTLVFIFRSYCYC